MQSQSALIAMSRSATQQAAGHRHSNKTAPASQPQPQPADAAAPVSFSVRNYGFRTVTIGGTACPPFSTTTVVAPANTTQSIMSSDTEAAVTEIDIGTRSIVGPATLRDNTFSQSGMRPLSLVVRNDAGTYLVRVWDAILGVPWFCVVGTLVSLAAIALVVVLVMRSRRR